MQVDRGIQASVRSCLVNSQTSVDVALVQKTHFTCAAECRVLEVDFFRLSAYGSRNSVGVSRLVGRSLNTDVNLVFCR